MKQKAMLIGGILSVVVLIFCILFWNAYVKVLNMPVEELENVVVKYYDSQADGYYRKIVITNQNELMKIYTALRCASRRKTILFADSDSEPDAAWTITLEFAEGKEVFDNTYYKDVNGIRKYIRTPISEGYILLSSEEVYGIVEQIIKDFKEENY